MLKVCLYYFSGTDNTRKIAELYKKEIPNSDVTIYQIKKDNSEYPNPNDFDLIGFGYPIHGFNAPEAFYKFIKQLPTVNNIKTFIFKTSGEPLHVNDSSSQKSLRCLIKKGYEVLSEKHYVMPYNIIFRHSDAMAKQMWIYAKGFVKVHVSEILNDVHEKISKPWIFQIHTAIVRIEWPFAKVHGKAFKIDYDKCISCQKCLKNCPMENISYNDGKFKFHNNCALCLRCSFYCPTNEISIGFLNGWKVNGDYHLDSLIKNESIPFPALENESKKMQKVYTKYFAHLDELFIKNQINLSELIK